MRALVYHGPGQKAWEEVADPEISDEGDVIVRGDATTICGTAASGALKVVLTREEEGVSAMNASPSRT